MQHRPYTQFYSDRRATVDMIVVHSISEHIWWPESKSGEQSRYVPVLEWLTRPVPGKDPISAHAYIDPEGGVNYICDENHKAWHAGRSRWNGETDLNRVSLGVELVVEGAHDWFSFLRAIREPDCYNSLQYRALGWLIYIWCLAHVNITHDRIVAHSQISGDDVRGEGKGKPDPGDGFDWERMWEEIEKWEGDDN